MYSRIFNLDRIFISQLDRDKKIQTDVCRYYVLFTRNEIVHKTLTPAFDKGVNALNLVLQTLLMFSRSI